MRKHFEAPDEKLLPKIYMRVEIAKFLPSPEDLNYPAKLESTAEAADFEEELVCQCHNSSALCVE
jgi:hypothetical protein